MYTIAIQTVILIATFAAAYLFTIVRKTARRQMDIYDLVMLSTVAIVPFSFAAFPNFAFWLAKSAGVEFPFVVMFGILFAILFIFIHRLTIKIHKIELDNRMLIQELSLLRESTECVEVNIDSFTKNGSFN